MAEDHLRCQSLKEFAAFLVSLENPPLEFDSEAGEFSARIKSTQVSPVKDSSSSTVVQLDTSTQEEHEVHGTVKGKTLFQCLVDCKCSLNLARDKRAGKIHVHLRDSEDTEAVCLTIYTLG